MGLVDRFERKLESTVGDAFARVFELGRKICAIGVPNRTERAGTVKGKSGESQYQVFRTARRAPAARPRAPSVACDVRPPPGRRPRIPFNAAAAPVCAPQTILETRAPVK